MQDTPTAFDTTDAVMASLPGWFGPQDHLLFRWFLSTQNELHQSGDLAELGAYLGKSAVVIGDYVQHGETFTVVDLFGDDGDDPSNDQENAESYPELTRDLFERNYRRAHASLPAVVQGLSTTIRDHARGGAHRFVHVDASHLYEHVRSDIATARTLLGPAGVVVFDDIRSLHTPGVSAAVWQAVTTDALQVIVVGDTKLYGTWSDPEPWRRRLEDWLPSTGLHWERQTIAGSSVLRASDSPTVPHPVGTAQRLVRAAAPPALLQLAVRARERFRRRRPTGL